MQSLHMYLPGLAERLGQRLIFLDLSHGSGQGGRALRLQATVHAKVEPADRRDVLAPVLLSVWRQGLMLSWLL